MFAAAVVLLPVSFLPALLWHDLRRFEKRDSALALPFLVALSLAMLSLGPLSGTMAFPLRDRFFVAADRALGFDVAAIIRWTAARAEISGVLSASYDLLPYLIVLAIGACALGNKRTAWTFLGANVIAEIVALPLFVFFPAIGPWAGYGFAANGGQRMCEASVWALRTGTPGQIAGIVCFPSFHVIWAMLAAAALWQIKPLRIPATVLAALIVLSTVTTGWHYAVDVFAGMFIAVVSWECADFIYRRGRADMEDRRVMRQIRFQARIGC